MKPTRWYPCPRVCLKLQQYGYQYVVAFLEIHLVLVEMRQDLHSCFVFSKCTVPFHEIGRPCKPLINDHDALVHSLRLAPQLALHSTSSYSATCSGTHRARSVLCTPGSNPLHFMQKQTVPIILCTGSGIDLEGQLLTVRVQYGSKNQ